MVFLKFFSRFLLPTAIIVTFGLASINLNAAARVAKQPITQRIGAAVSSAKTQASNSLSNAKLGVYSTINNASAKVAAAKVKLSSQLKTKPLAERQAADAKKLDTKHANELAKLNKQLWGAQNSQSKATSKRNTLAKAIESQARSSAKDKTVLATAKKRSAYYTEKSAGLEKNITAIQARKQALLDRQAAQRKQLIMSQQSALKKKEDAAAKREAQKATAQKTTLSLRERLSSLNLKDRLAALRKTAAERKSAQKSNALSGKERVAKILKGTAKTPVPVPADSAKTPEAGAETKPAVGASPLTDKSQAAPGAPDTKPQKAGMSMQKRMAIGGIAALGVGAIAGLGSQIGGDSSKSSDSSNNSDAGATGPSPLVNENYDPMSNTNGTDSNTAEAW
jgi:hypothetical protein